MRTVRRAIGLSEFVEAGRRGEDRKREGLSGKGCGGVSGRAGSVNSTVLVLMRLLPYDLVCVTAVAAGPGIH